MEKWRRWFFILLASMVVSSSFCLEGEGEAGKTTYIVIMDKKSKPESLAGEESDWFRASLSSVSESADMLYTYRHALQGFAATLSAEEAELLSLSPGVTAVVKQKKYHLHTTRSPEFLPLTSLKAEDQPANVSDVIIGVLDGGVWPYSKSFKDDGLGPVPARWNGGCDSRLNQSDCNRKLIGAKLFVRAAAAGGLTGTVSPLDEDGHGTHTISTAGGAEVENSSFLGFGEGTARGMATTARVAAYKVCWSTGCYNADILAGIEEAIEDGVDILSISLGSSDEPQLADDIISLGLLHATAKGILVVMSAGNSGPEAKTLDNGSPWITTVAASTLDRHFPVDVKLGNGKILTGTSLYGSKPPPENLPLVLAKNASINSTIGEFCVDGNLNVNLTRGKIVVCRRGFTPSVLQGLAVRKAEGAGMILYNGPAEGEALSAIPDLLPSAAIGFISAQEVLSDTLTGRNPTATIGTPTTVVGDKSAPVLADFSSRGPSKVVPGLVKPDLTAPGVNIIAAWSRNAPPTGLPDDNRTTEFNFLTGTSMSCPHVAGLAALVKAKHRDWTPAAVRSALMTTAYYKHADGSMIVDAATSNPATPFDMGSGHVDPVSALEPGLVYDAGLDDYLEFICAMKLDPTKLLVNAGINFATNFSCSPNNTYNSGDLNYPSFSVLFPAKDSVVQQTRTLTNVVSGSSTYTLRVSEAAPKAPVKISVEPSSLTFDKIYQKLSFNVTFTATAGQTPNASFARLEWTDGKHIVSSPIAMQW